MALQGFQVLLTGDTSGLVPKAPVYETDVTRKVMCSSVLSHRRRYVVCLAGISGRRICTGKQCNKVWLERGECLDHRFRAVQFWAERRAELCISHAGEGGIVHDKSRVEDTVDFSLKSQCCHAHPFDLRLVGAVGGDIDSFASQPFQFGAELGLSWTSRAASRQHDLHLLL